MTFMVNLFALGSEYPLQGAPLHCPAHTILHDNELKGRCPGNSAVTDAEAEDRDNSKFAGGNWLDEVRDEATKHHHRASDRDADAHGTVARGGADAGERLVLTLGIKAREPASASLVVAVK